MHSETGFLQIPLRPIDNNSHQKNQKLLIWKKKFMLDEICFNK